MTLAESLTLKQTEMLDWAESALDRHHLAHYEETDRALRHERLRRLLQLTIEAMASRNLHAILDYIEKVARERFAGGFQLQEVQTAINVLEEALWREIMAECPPAELGEALGLVSTILGAAKDRLGTTYVDLATQGKTRTLNLAPLFKGI